MTTTSRVRSKLKQALDRAIEFDLPDDDKAEVAALYSEGHAIAAVDPDTAMEYVREIGFFCDIHSRELIGYVLNPWGGLSRLYAHDHERKDWVEMSADEVEEQGFDSTMRVTGMPILKRKES